MASKPELLLQARRFQVLRLTRQVPDGTQHQYDVIKHPGSVVILPIVYMEEENQSAPSLPAVIAYGCTPLGAIYSVM